MRYYWMVVLLAGCTASNWTKEGTTAADLDRDYDECRMSAKPDAAIPAIAGAFGVIGVFVGTTYNDFRIRDCLEARGWGRNGQPPATPAVATSGTPATDGMAAAPAPAAALVPVNATEADAGAAKRLRDLKSLLDQGLITKEEYEERRQAVLRGL